MVSKLNSERQAGESAGGAMSRIYQRIGFAGLWNGLPVRIVMIGTLTGLQWYLPKDPGTPEGRPQKQNCFGEKLTSF
jgi:hypothetical protein